jgi:ketosteroid isomerase-like protein
MSTAETTTPSGTAPGTLDLAAFAAAIENRDADALLAWYAPDATMTLLDRDHPPATPTVLEGLAAVDSYLRDVCARNIEHRVSDVVATADGLAFVQHCRYPEGNGVVCTSVAVLRSGRIQSQTSVQVWDA